MSFPSGSGTWLLTAKPSRSVQNLMHGSTVSTIRTGVSCLRLGLPADFSFASVIDHLGTLTITKKRSACEADRFFCLSSRSRDRGVPALVRVKAGTKHATNYAEYSEIHPRLNGDVAIGRVRCLQHHRAVLVRVGLD